MITAIYARISHDPNGTEKGVQRQVEDGRLLTDLRDWGEVKEFIDTT